jgi:alanyl-tRNA synthetase
MGALMKQATARIGGRGGGNPALAMGSAPDVETMRQTLEWAKQALIIDPSDQ